MFWAEGAGPLGERSIFVSMLYIYVSDPKIIPKCMKINLKMTTPQKKKNSNKKLITKIKLNKSWLEQLWLGSIGALSGATQVT